MGEDQPQLPVGPGDKLLGIDADTAKSFYLLGDRDRRHRGPHQEDEQECGIKVLRDLADGLAAADVGDLGRLARPRARCLAGAGPLAE